ncbi:MAG TPA: hypothetical protein VGK09_10610 [Rhodocyclaceae bacterium]|jgi:hypothetical protein
MKTVLSVTGLLLGLILAIFVLPTFFHSKDDVAEPSHGLPWQIDTLYGGKSRVFDLILGENTLDDAKLKLGNDMQVALIAAPNETGTVEAFFDRVNTGFITGKMIITAEIPAETLEKMKERALKRDYMESSTRKISLAPQDMQVAMQSQIRAISFIPSINLDAGMVEQRFGTPAERIKVGTTEHMLYPEKGLDVVVDTEGKELLQYVAPGRFAQLKDPLLVKQK